MTPLTKSAQRVSGRWLGLYEHINTVEAQFTFCQNPLCRLKGLPASAYDQEMR